MIKCQECGKEISDKANACIHCGCPVEKQITCSECNQEKVIINTKLNKLDILKVKELGFIVEVLTACILFLVFLFMFKNIIMVIILTLFLFLIIHCMNNSTCKKMEHCSLTLTNKRIYGICLGVVSSGKVNSFEKVDFQLNQVSSISKLSDSVGDSVRIYLSARNYINCPSSNADEFIMAVEKELNKLKNSIYA